LAIYSQGQTDTTKLQQQQIQTIKILNEQTQMQQQIQQSYVDAKEKIFGSIQDVTSVRRTANDKLKIWYKTTLDSIETGKITNIEIDDLDRIRKDREDKIESEYHRSIEFLYSRNKYKSLRVFPAFNGYMSMLYYNSDKRFDFFQNTNLSFGNDNGSFESEVVSGYLWIFRASLSTVLSRESLKKINSNELKGLTDLQVDSLVIATDKSNLANNTLLKVISGGGEANLNFKAPLLNLWGNKKGKIKIKSDIVGRISAGLPIAGSSIPESEISIFNLVGIENRIIIPVINFDTKKKEGYEAFALFGKYDFKNVGGSETFYSSLGISQKRFWYAEYSIGLTFKNYLIYYTNQTFYNNSLEGNNKGRLAVALIKEF
jgi:hypothetical protein